MDAQAMGYLYQGAAGYVWVKQIEHADKQGALLYYANPDPRKLHAVDVTGMQEMEEGVAAVEAAAERLDFLILHGAYDPIHAGADITQFAGDPDVPAIKTHLDRGTALDARIKLLWPRLRTVAINCGDRYGGSVEWPQFAEWGVADTATRIQFSEVHLGIVPGWNGVLNVLLKSGADNALYMGTTGNAVAAAELLQLGIVQTVVEAPTAPNRREIEREDWPKAWADHAETCQALLLAAALELATQANPPVRNTGFSLASADKLAAELTRRTTPAPYLALRDSVVQALTALGGEPAKDDLKALNKHALKELVGLGKPLAPAAVAGLKDYVAKWAAISSAELLANYSEAGQEEADLCTALMHTEHRRRGINAVLSKDPTDRVPIFD